MVTKNKEKHVKETDFKTLQSLPTDKINKIKEVIHHSETAETVANALFLRQRMRNFTIIQNLKYELLNEGHRIIEADFDKFWEELEQAGMGVIVYGQNVRRNRFEWHYNLRYIIQAGMEGKLHIPEKASNKLSHRVVGTVKAQAKRVDAAPKAKAGSLKKVFVAMKNGDIETILVPSDSSESFVEGIIKKMQSMK
jgi:hypothetical protein